MKIPGRIFKSFVFFCLALGPFQQVFVAAQPSVIETIQNFLPSIVNIRAENKTVGNSGGKIVAASFERKGAGVIIAPSGYIITNSHIVSNAHKIIITLFDARIFEAKVVSILPETDLALLNIQAPGPLISAELADSDTFSLGDEVFTVGHSQILDQTISEGRIIGLGVQRLPSGRKTATQLFQVNMNLYKGDSGGPLFDRKGRLAGIIVAGQAGAQHSSFVVPSNSIKKLYLDASVK